MKNLKVLGLGLMVGLGVVLLGAGWGWAATLYVDPVSGPYTTIQAAVNAAVSGDEIVVKPGTYSAVDVNKLVYIRSEKGPEVTKIISTGEYGVLFEKLCSNSTLTGFYIRGTSYGIYCLNAQNSNYCNNVVVKNNIIEGCGKHGIFLYAINDCSQVHYWNIDNNVIAGNGQNGIQYQATNLNCDGNVNYNIARNNIIINNGQYGIALVNNWGDIGNGFYNNDIFNNVSGPSSGVAITVSDGNIFDSPQFVDVNTGNYMLQSSSTCINTGSAGSAFLDPDGTRNNMGVYGGPGSASFWPYPEGGPVITEMSVTPASVPQGGTISIKATGSVR